MFFFFFSFILLRSKLTSDAEKESVMMFGRNLRQLLLTSPVRGRTLMGVDPGYKHGCKLAIISPTSKSSLNIFERTNKSIFIWRKKNLLFYQMYLCHKLLVFSTHTVMQIPFIRLKVKFLAPGFHCLLWCYYPSLNQNLKSFCLLESRFKELCLSVSTERTPGTFIV